MEIWSNGNYLLFYDRGMVISQHTEKKPLPKIVKNRSGRSFLVKIEVSRTQLVILMNSRSKIVKNTNSHSGLVKF